MFFLQQGEFFWQQRELPLGRLCCAVLIAHTINRSGSRASVKAPALPAVLTGQDQLQLCMPSCSCACCLQPPCSCPLLTLPAAPTSPWPCLQIKVIGNTGSNNTNEALHATEQGFGVGMHASLQVRVICVSARFVFVVPQALSCAV